MRNKLMLLVAFVTLFTGCAASTRVVGTVVLPTSNKTIDVVQHRSDNRGCVELVVLQTFDASGVLVDSAAGRGQTLPCLLTEVVIESGSRVGSAALIANGMVRAARATKPDTVSVDNSNDNVNAASQVQGQGQAQLQGQAQGQQQKQGIRWRNGHAEHGEGHGNNGQGNGDGDGINPGTDNHHNNGDND